MADCQHLKDRGFDPGFAVEIHAMTDDGEGSHTTQLGETVNGFDVLAKEYMRDGCVEIHFDESFATYELAQEAARPWEEKWDVAAEDIGDD
jgi:hypothetical protein